MASNFKIKMTPTNQAFTLKNTSITGKRLDELNDVVESTANKVDGAVLVYQANTDTYVLRDGFLQVDDNGDISLGGGDF